jgi:AhpD family alkylhydroperoxidase
MSEQAVDIPVPSDEELGPEMVAALARFPALNVHRYVALSPKCFSGWQELLAGIYATGLDPRLRETVICRIGSVASCEYELFQHTALARGVGVSEPELQAIQTERPVTSLSDEANLLCQVADELHGGGPLTDATYEAFLTHRDPHEAMAWLILIGHYAAVVRVLNGARVPMESEQRLAGEATPLG